MFTLLYADDTVLTAESKENFHLLLDAVYEYCSRWKLKEYCSRWKLKVNVYKSKVLIFSDGRLPKNLCFKD